MSFLIAKVIKDDGKTENMDILKYGTPITSAMLSMWLKGRNPISRYEPQYMLSRYSVFASYLVERELCM